MENKIVPLQTEVSQKCKEILKKQKKKQRKTMGLIIEELVMEKYQSLQDKLKEIE